MCFSKHIHMPLRVSEAWRKQSQSQTCSFTLSVISFFLPSFFIIVFPSLFLLFSPKEVKNVDVSKRVNVESQKKWTAKGSMTKVWTAVDTGFISAVNRRDDQAKHSLFFPSLPLYFSFSCICRPFQCCPVELSMVLEMLCAVSSAVATSPCWLLRTWNVTVVAEE